MSLLAILLAGWGLVAAGFPRRPADGVERAFRAAIAVALGIGAWSASYAGWRLAFGESGLAKDVLLAAAGAASVIAFRLRPPEQVPERESAPRWLWAVFALAVAVAAAAFVEHTVRFPDGGWDAWMVWNLRARFLVRADDLRTAFSPRMAFLAHQDYPWLVPGVVAQAFARLGESPLVAPAVAAVFGILAVAVVTLSVARVQGMRWGLLAGLAVCTLPCFATFASNQQSDVPLALYFAIAAAILTQAQSRRELVLAGFAAGLAMWTKNEGALYAGCLLAAWLWRARDARGALAFAAGALPCTALLLCFKLGLAPSNDLAAFSTRTSLVANALDVRRWAELALLTARRMVYFQDFALWVLAAFLLLVSHFRQLPASVLGTALLLAFAAYAPIYVLQPHRLDWIFRTSADRILIQLWPAVVLAAIPALARTTART
ncbi:MAG TPA: glycosyltransferase family 39 protein [Myxococcales bacterium]|nr:glycosyltransferase family 39 protein [Myxococcales bacterium]